MNIFIFRSNNTIGPFDKKASELMLGEETIYHRLLRQLQQIRKNNNAHEIQSGDDIAQIKHLQFNHWTLVIGDHVYLTENLWMELQKTISTKKFGKNSFQVAVKTNNILPLSSLDTSDSSNISNNSVTPLFLYFLAPGDTIQNCPLIEFSYHKEVNLNLHLPENIFGLKNLGLRLNPLAGITIEHWEHFHLAASLRAREVSFKSIYFFGQFLPQSLLSKVILSPYLSEKFNKIGKRCRIHRTAILEGCEIGDDVEIGPYCYLRASRIGSRTWIREHSSIKLATVEADCGLMTTDLFNVVIGSHSMIFTSILHNCALGEGVFIGGGSGFSDFPFGQQNVKFSVNLDQISQLRIEAPSISMQHFLGSAIGPGVNVGAGLIFKPGQELPAKSTYLNHNMIDRVPLSGKNKYFLAKGNQLLSIPSNFIFKQ